MSTNKVEITIVFGSKFEAKPRTVNYSAGLGRSLKDNWKMDPKYYIHVILDGHICTNLAEFESIALIIQ